MSKLNNFIKSRTFIITLTLTFIVLIIAGVTYAWFTWSSTDNTNITMQIGEYTTVTYTGGNAINVNNLTPVYNYTDGESTTFSLTNNNSNPLKEFKYNVYLDITSINNELKSTSLKYVLLDSSSNVVDQGNFSAASNSSTLTITENKILPSGTSSYTFIIYLDGNEQNNTNMMNKSLTGSLRVTVVKENVVLEPNPITDFEYEIGTDTFAGYVILTEYIGSSPMVVIPDEYEINSVTYDTALSIYVYTNATGLTTFSGNTVVETVILPNNYNVKFYTQYNSGQGYILKNDTIAYMFKGCTSLVNAPTIPNSVINMQSTFYGCTSLVNAPTIPNSVTNMQYTFRNCTSLVTAPTIPNTVTNMSGTFFDCTNLTGTVRVNSSNVNLTAGGFAAEETPFYGTVLPITVEVPANSQTYNHFTARGKPANVTVTTFTP